MKKQKNPIEAAPPRITVLDGDDTVGREKARERIVRKIYEIHGNVLEERYDSSREGFIEFIQRIISPSLFQEIRIFHVRHAEDLCNNDKSLLADTIKTIIPDVYLIIEIDKNDGRGKKDGLLKMIDIKRMANEGPGEYAYMTFSKPPEYKAAEWLASQVPVLFGRKMSKESAEYFIDCVGNNPDILHSELQKLDIHLSAGKPIDKQAIDGVIGANRAMNAFELSKTLGDKNLLRTFDIVDSLFSVNFYAPICVSAIFRHFWVLYRIRCYAETNASRINRYLSNKISYEEKNKIAHDVGMVSGLLAEGDSVKKAYPVVVKSGIIEQASSFTREQIFLIFSWLREYDVGIKTGRIEPRKSIFQLLCYKIACVAELGKEVLN